MGRERENIFSILLYFENFLVVSCGHPRVSTTTDFSFLFFSLFFSTTAPGDRSCPEGINAIFNVMHTENKTLRKQVSFLKQLFIYFFFEKKLS